MLASTKKIVETQLASNANVHLHMKGWLTDLIEEAKSLSQASMKVGRSKEPRPAPFVLEHRSAPDCTEWGKVEDRVTTVRDAMNASRA